MAKRNGKARKARVRTSEEPLINRFAKANGDYGTSFAPDPEGEGTRQHVKLVRVTRNFATVDRWLDQGGPGFEEPQKRAVTYFRNLWQRAGNTGSLVANLDGMPSGGAGRSVQAQHEAILELKRHEEAFPNYVWDAFEMVVRWDEPAGFAGSRLANNTVQRQAHAKACVGFVLSKVAERERF